jgi:peptide deformylase
MKSVRVKRVDKSIQALIEDMLETMRQAEGIGLAAPQIGVLLRVIVAEYPDEEVEDLLHQTVVINPEVIAKEGEWMAEEGCLSVPGYVGTVPRAVSVTVKGKDRSGKDLRIKTDGMLAHILQHEIDHLNGVLYIDYLSSLDELRKVEPGTRRRRRRRSDTGDSEPAADDDGAGEGVDGVSSPAGVADSVGTAER